MDIAIIVIHQDENLDKNKNHYGGLQLLKEHVICFVIHPLMTDT